MRWIKKEFDEDGNPEWAVYIDEAGEGREDDWVTLRHLRRTRRSNRGL
jgi:hypothetical protein